MVLKHNNNLTIRSKKFLKRTKTTGQSMIDAGNVYDEGDGVVYSGPKWNTDLT